jgi:hypothetical protein
MNEVLKKIKLTAQNPVLILNAPEEYANVMKDIEGEVHTSIKGKYEFIQLFASSLVECEKLTPPAIEALEGDGYLWVCYPKGTSKKYKSDLNRDTARELIGTYNYEPVTLVAIDNDWSALRIKNPDNIKTMKRKSAASEKGKERIDGKA